MRKLMLFAACAMLAAVTQAASVGWSLAGAGSFAVLRHRAEGRDFHRDHHRPA